MDLPQQIEQFLESEFAGAEHNVIFYQDDGSYNVFKLYQIKKTHDLVQVTKRHTLIGEFSSLRVALSWCIADKFQHYRLCTEITMLDQQRVRMRYDTQAQREFVKHCRDHEIKDVVRSKLDNRTAILKQVEKRLDKCVSLAKYYQLRGFNDEIARTRRPTPNRTDRSRDRKSSRS